VECPALLLLGSDDAIKLWWNGKLVHANNSYRAASPGQDQALVKLKKGKNTLLVKLMEGIFGCGFYFQIVTNQGSAIPGLKGYPLSKKISP